MSTNTHTEPGTVSEPAQLPEQTDDLEEVDDLDEVVLPHLECPIDGTLISRKNQLGTSSTTYECPHCKGVWKLWEVFHER
jgi:hypothetical protein